MLGLLDRGLLREVAPGVWRGPQPTADEWEKLAVVWHGCPATIIKLNTDEWGDGPDTDTGAAALYGHKIARLGIPPIETWLAPLDVDPLVAAVNIITTDVNRPLLVHCRNGRDRTGLLCFAWRVATGWSVEDARAEADRFGFRGGVIHPRLQDAMDSIVSTLAVE